MPGPIMTAQQASKKYKGVTRKGNTVSLKNSDGRRITVGKNTRVYHRGNGNFGQYSASRDAKRFSKGAKTLKPVGTGRYRQTSDRGDGKKKRR